ncbi:MAG: thiol reductant ABC exporter subunit CydD [Acetobacteraceae bacterium]|nr:thiol reductant ABC exporter subunit CydD [Acetobacteraceae bacterium]
MAPADATAEHAVATEAAARRLLAHAARAERGRLVAPVLLGLAGTLAAIAQAWLIARLLAALLGLGTEAGWPEFAGAAALALVTTGLGLAQERAQQAAGEAAKARLRAAAFARLLEAGPLDARPVGERTALVVDRIEALEGYFARWLPAAALALLAPVLVAGAAALLADPASGLILLAAGLLVPLVQGVSGIGAAQAARRQFDALQRLSGRFLDRMRGLPTLVLFNQQEAEANRLGAVAQELRRRTMRVLRVAFLSSAGLELIAAGALALLAIRHGAALAAAAAATAGAPQGQAAAEGLFVLLLVPAFFAPLRGFAAAYHERLAARGAAAALAPLLDEARPDWPAPQPGLLLAEVPPKVTVTFQDVRLSYDPTRPPALDGLSFRVLPGETLVLAGASGSGKTSVLRLLMGFVRPDGGRIAINGRDVTLLRPSELRRLSAYVGQRAHLFRATLRENIRLARPDATDAQIEAAARAAGVMEFAAALPQGLDTLVGEGGWGLSGGQAQRVAVARAFLRDVPLVLLDEPTAHLDPGTEAAMWESLRRLCVGRTAIIATHSRTARNGALRGARVLEIAAGRALGTARAAGA